MALHFDELTYSVLSLLQAGVRYALSFDNSIQCIHCCNTMYLLSPDAAFPH